MVLYIHSNLFSGKLTIDTKCYHLSVITLYPRQQKFDFPKFESCRSLAGKFDFSVHQDLKFKAILITEPQKSSSTLVQLLNAV